MVNKKLIIFLVPLLIIFIILSYTGHINLKSHRLDKLEINVYINEDGSAKITEKRKANLVEGTENFIVLENLGDSEIKDFTVKENGILYEFKDYWNIYDSQREKTYKNGIVKTPFGYELCWGIGEYGYHNYEIQYTITNFIKQYKDRQGFYWKFVNDQMNIPPRDVKVIIESDKKFTDKNSSIWSFGHKGNISFDNGKIIAENSRPFNETNYLTILVGLEDNFFLTNSKIDSPFELVKKEAFKDNNYRPYNPVFIPSLKYTLEILGKAPFLLFMLMPLLARLIVSFTNKNTIVTPEEIVKPRKYQQQFHGEYCYYFPYKEDFIDIFYILYRMGVSKPKNLMTGLILKWIYQDSIKVIYYEAGYIFKRKKVGLKFIEPSIESITLEGKLYSMMEIATDKNFILDKKAFSKWIKEDSYNLDSMKLWEKRLLENSLNKLINNKYVDVDYSLTPKGRNLENNIHRFINYLCNFSTINRSKTINIEELDNLMIWAGLLGITDTFNKEILKLHSNYKSKSRYREQGIILIETLTDKASKTVKNMIPIIGPSGGSDYDNNDYYNDYGSGSFHRGGSSGSSGSGSSSGGSSGGGSGGGTR